jgi:hypothetical protein
MFNTTQVTAHAVGSAKLFRDDHDRRAFLRRFSATRWTIYSYCLMDNHVHFLVEGTQEAVEPLTRRVFADFKRFYCERYSDFQGQLFLEPIDFRPKSTESDIKNAVKYHHENPKRANLVAMAWEYPWSSARAFVGLTRVSCVDVTKVRSVLGHLAPYVVEDPVPPTPDLEPVETPRTTLPVLLAAAAQTYHVDPAHLGPNYAQRLRHVRVLFVRLARCEGYDIPIIARYLKKVRQYVEALGKGSVDPEAFRIARTLAMTPSLMIRLPPTPVFTPSPRRGRSRRTRKALAASAAEVVLPEAELLESVSSGESSDPGTSGAET